MANYNAKWTFPTPPGSDYEKHIPVVEGAFSNPPDEQSRSGKFHPGHLSEHGDPRTHPRAEHPDPTGHKFSIKPSSTADDAHTRSKLTENTPQPSHVEGRGRSRLIPRNPVNPNTDIGNVSYKMYQQKDDGGPNDAFYDENSKHYIGNNPYRTVNPEADDYIHNMAEKLVGAPGFVKRGDDGVIENVEPRGTQNRENIQKTLHRLSQGLYSSYAHIGKDPSKYRYKDQPLDANLHTGDATRINNDTTYQEFASDLNYLNKAENPNRWKGTPKYINTGRVDSEGNPIHSMKFAKTGGDDHEIDTTRNESPTILDQNVDDSGNYYFKPLLSEAKINVADNQSANTLAHIFRMFFDLQVLYYKKHVEILQVFQLLVIFFEKYNYSINALMYVLEHLVKDGVKPEKGDSQAVSIPIDFIMDINNMLTDQRKMMNAVSTLKMHLGMDKGGIDGSGDNISMPDAKIFLTGEDGVYRDIIFGDMAGSNSHKIRYPAYYLPSVPLPPGSSSHPLVMDHLGPSTGAPFFAPGMTGLPPGTGAGAGGAVPGPQLPPIRPAPRSPPSGGAIGDDMPDVPTDVPTIPPVVPTHDPANNVVPDPVPPIIVSPHSGAGTNSPENESVLTQPVEQPSVEQPSVEQPSVEQPSVEQPSVEQPSVEQRSRIPVPNQQLPNQQLPPRQPQPGEIPSGIPRPTIQQPPNPPQQPPNPPQQPLQRLPPKYRPDASGKIPPGFSSRSNSHATALNEYIGDNKKTGKAKLLATLSRMKDNTGDLSKRAKNEVINDIMESLDQYTLPPNITEENDQPLINLIKTINKNVISDGDKYAYTSNFNEIMKMYPEK
jgi:hypothetical protein